MSDLKPCPFCGGEVMEALSKRWTNCLGDVSWSAYVRCDSCEYDIETDRCGYKTEEEAIKGAIEAWNTRAESVFVTGTTVATDREPVVYAPMRTCELTFKRGAMYDVAHYSCCGYEFPESVSEESVAENYCPNCGAKVVGE